MANNQQRDNSGVCFRNDKREKDTHPNYRGNCMVDGVEYWMDSWIKEGAKGKFLTFSFKRKDASQSQSSNRQSKPSFHDDLNDELPPF